MTTIGRWAGGALVGLVLPACAALLAWAVSTDDSIGGTLMPYGFLITVTWWVAVVLGVAAAISIARHWAVGVLVAIGAAVLLQVSLALVADPAARAGVWASGMAWAGALVGAIVPWALGTAFGSMVGRGRRERYDGARGHS